MRIPTFTFKNEAVWMVVFPFVPAVLGVLMFMVIWLIRLLF
jgi:hypothetical protein